MDIGDLFGNPWDRPFGDPIPGVVHPKHEHLLTYHARVQNRINLYTHALHVLRPTTGGR